MSYSVAIGGPADIPAMRRIEADPRYDGLVGRWSHEQHEAEMALGTSRYFVLRAAAGDVVGFALVQKLDDIDLKRHLKRIAVAEPGGGLGSMLLEGVLDALFESDANRVDLDVFLGNERARRAYEKAGFEVEGVLRDYHRNADGTYSSMWLMSVLRRDWEISRRCRTR